MLEKNGLREGSAGSRSYVDLDRIRIDDDRLRRTGVPEAVFAEHKTEADVVLAVATLAERDGFALATRVPPAYERALRADRPEGEWNADARAWRVGRLPRSGSRIGVVCAGTSDLPVAEEAAFVLEAFGHTVVRRRDAGVAGVHRLLADFEEIASCDVLVVVAGMEGALPSVVAGLVQAPVIAVPTSIGYGAAFGGLAAVLGMLTSCAPGIGVVNIDNGFGAAALAHKMVRAR